MVLFPMAEAEMPRFCLHEHPCLMRALLQLADLYDQDVGGSTLFCILCMAAVFSLSRGETPLEPPTCIMELRELKE